MVHETTELCVGFDADHFLLIPHIFAGDWPIKIKKFSLYTLGWPQIAWFLKQFHPSTSLEGIDKTIVVCNSSLANTGAFSGFRSNIDWLKTRFFWERIVWFSTLRLFLLLRKTKKVYNLLKIFTSTTKLSGKSFQQSQRWLKRYFCWATNFPSLMFFRVTCFIFAIQQLHAEQLDVVSLGWELANIFFLTWCIVFENNFWTRATLVEC